MTVTVDFAAGRVGEVRFRFVRHNDRNETVFRAPADEGATLDRLAAKSAARLAAEGDWVRVAL